MSGSTRLWSVHSRGLLPVALTVALVATACGGSTQVSVDVRSPQMSTVFEAAVETDGKAAVATIDSLGDPLAPGLGNGGYDVVAYDLAMKWVPELTRFETTAVVTATATQDLPRFNLDFGGTVVRSVQVDGAAADYQRSVGELTITPESSIATGSPFKIEITYLNHPTEVAAQSMLAPGKVGWIETSDPAWYARSAPDGAHTWLPVNDHPSDPAVFASNITVPDGLTAAASGRFKRTIAGVDEHTSQWQTSAEIPPHAMTVLVGNFDLVEDVAGSDATGVQLRHMLPLDMKGEMPPVLHRVDDMILFLEQRLGPFPYDAWGVAVVADAAPTKPANSWTIMSRADLEASDVELRMMRDLASHYFGQAVGMSSWSDIWIGEAISTYLQWLWLQGIVGRTGLDVTIAAARARVNNAGWPAPDEPRFGDVYVGSGPLRGALFLHALSLKVGQSDFFEVLSTAYREYSGGPMSTADFFDVIEQVTGERIRAFADAWFNRDPLPGFPGS